MSKPMGSVAPKERINIKYVPATGDQQSELELPLKLLVTGDFKGQPEHVALEERQAVRIDKDTFNEVLAKAGYPVDDVGAVNAQQGSAGAVARAP
ncbi:type VI secretion system contractile sheath small subunit, partial [Pseudomonas sp. MAFF212427]|nr:type VI secretion system contractile sheath small subunit [Pseudomonas brassicae]